MFDLVIRGGEVVDGSGGPRRRADVAVRNGSIVEMGEVRGESRHTVDAGGLIVAPGFVDPHTHFDAAVAWDPALTPSPLHGVTTALAGNCGFTVAPLSDAAADYVMRMLSVVEGMPLEALAQGCEWKARRFADFVGALDGRLAINIGFGVGHSTLRRMVMGERAIGERATRDDIAAMVELAHQAMSEGALGFTTSIGDAHNDAEGRPVPSRHADAGEFAALAATVREHEGTNLGITPPVGPFSDATLELLTRMSLAGDRPISWNVMMVEAAHRDIYEGQIIGGDYAHERGASIIALTVPELSRLRLSFDNGMILNLVPGWGEILALPLPERRRALGDPEVRRRMVAGYASMPEGTIRTRLTWSKVRLGATYAPEYARYAQRPLGDSASEAGRDPLELLLEIVAADDLRTDIWPVAPGDDDESWRLRQSVWTDPRVVFGGGDAGAHLDMTQSWRYFTTLLGEHVRDKARLPLETAVHLITARPARLFGLRNRGTLQIGAAADITVFDPATIGSGELTMRADLPGGASRIWSQAHGLNRVFVNGVEIVRDSELTGEIGGQVLRSGRDTYTVTPRDFPSAGAR